MAIKKEHKKTTATVPEPEQEHDVVRRARSFWDQFSKPVMYIGSAIIIIILGWYAYLNLVKGPAEQKANDAVFTIQKSFQQFASANADTVKMELAQVCLNGDGTSNNIGALKFISKYSGTDASNLCHYYAGACYLYLKQFDNAVNKLKDFSTDAHQIQSRAYGMMGDAYSELKKNDDALDYYKKAAAVNEKDEYTSSEYLFRAGLFAESIGKKKDAIDLLKKIKEKYPLTEKGNDVDRYLARMGEVNE